VSTHRADDVAPASRAMVDMVQTTSERLAARVAFLEAENKRLHRMVMDHVKYGWNRALFDYAAEHNDGTVSDV
jgi:hypothetical protein